MPRRLLTVASTASLVLWLAIVALWVRSCYSVDLFTLAGTRLHRFASGGGGLFIESFGLAVSEGSWRNRNSGTRARSIVNYAKYERTADPTAPQWFRQTLPYRGRADMVRRSIWGPDSNRALPRMTPVARTRTSFDKRDGRMVQERLTGQRLWLPYWLLFVVTAFLPATRLSAMYYRCRRSRLGRCISCGYDLRASVGRCPECGTVVSGNPEVDA